MGELLFVYGTLKKGFPNHQRYLSRAKFLGHAESVEKYALYISGIPFVVEGEKVSRIKGEVYEVDEETLKRIDELEGHPNFYYRKKILVKLSNNRILEAWMYFYPKSVGKLVLDGEYKILIY